MSSSRPLSRQAVHPALTSAFDTSVQTGAEATSTVFIVAIDDSPTIRAVIEYSFARVGARVVTFADGAEALRALGEGRMGVPHLILLDIGMPGLDGYEVATVLRRKDLFVSTPIVMLSGHDGLVDRLRSKMVGAHAFIAKPFRPRDLVAFVFEQLGLELPTGPTTSFDLDSR